MTDQEKIYNCIQTVSSAYRDLDQARDDFKDLSESALDELAGSVSITKEDRKNIKKVAKAMAKDSKDKVVTESESLAGICEAVAAVRQ